MDGWAGVPGEHRHYDREDTASVNRVQESTRIEQNPEAKLTSLSRTYTQRGAQSRREKRTGSPRCFPHSAPPDTHPHPTAAPGPRAKPPLPLPVLT